MGGNGKIRVLSSNDGEQWESAAVVRKEGIDRCDPKFSVTPDGRPDSLVWCHPVPCPYTTNACGFVRANTPIGVQ